ncbi:hypothetical protein KA050_00130 [Candidatus Gracilibacteria bacterium]|nr:hypothetical protein [Candidatus Gracilibacteria bacterium]
MNKKMGIEALGWYGTLAIMGAYFGNSFGYLETQSITYQTLNASGALGIVLVSYMKSAYQPMVLNMMWFFIGIIALGTLIF